jgi:hypothetical protein
MAPASLFLDVELGCFRLHQTPRVSGPTGNSGPRFFMIRQVRISVNQVRLLPWSIETGFQATALNDGVGETTAGRISRLACTTWVSEPMK